MFITSPAVEFPPSETPLLRSGLISVKLRSQPGNNVKIAMIATSVFKLNVFMYLQL